MIAGKLLQSLRSAIECSQRACKQDHTAVMDSCLKLADALKLSKLGKADLRGLPKVAAESIWLPNLCKQVSSGKVVSEPYYLPLAGRNLSRPWMCHALVRIVHPNVHVHAQSWDDTFIQLHGMQAGALINQAPAVELSIWYVPSTGAGSLQGAPEPAVPTRLSPAAGISALGLSYCMLDILLVSLSDGKIVSLFSDSAAGRRKLNPDLPVRFPIPMLASRSIRRALLLPRRTSWAKCAAQIAWSSWQ